MGRTNEQMNGRTDGPIEQAMIKSISIDRTNGVDHCNIARADRWVCLQGHPLSTR